MGSNLVCTNFDNYVPQWWVEFNNELSWLFTNRFSATRYMKVKRMGITEILRRIWLFSANKTKSSESFSKQPTQLIVELNSLSQLWHCILSSKMSWVGCLLKDSLLFIFFAENSQILLKIYIIPILVTFIYLVAVNLLVNNQLNSTHHCGT